MSDLIRRSDAIQAFDELLKSPYASNKDPFGRGIRDALKLARDMMKNNVPKSLSIPAVDAVEGVVRCRNCVHYYDVLRQGTQFERGLCDRWGDGTAFEPDDYCSHGQRREDGDA